MIDANYHTHTNRCQHAKGEDREYVEASIQAGIKILGFSDHCPWIFPDNYVSPIRMTPAETETYFSSLEALKKEYQNDIRIVIGFEAEYIPELIEEQTKFLADFPVDYMILGQHFLGPEKDSAFTGTPTDKEVILKRYVDTVIEAMKTGNYLYVAHPDLIHFTGPEEIYEKHMLRLCQYLKEADIPIEINLLGAFEGRHYPSCRFLQIAKKAGNSCIIGVDAHMPEQLLNQKGYALCRQLIKKYGLRQQQTLLS